MQDRHPGGQPRHIYALRENWSASAARNALGSVMRRASSAAGASGGSRGRKRAAMAERNVGMEGRASRRAAADRPECALPRSCRSASALPLPRKGGREEARCRLCQSSGRQRCTNPTVCCCWIFLWLRYGVSVSRRRRPGQHRGWCHSNRTGCAFARRFGVTGLAHRRSRRNVKKVSVG